jgi:hypothetical protein
MKLILLVRLSVCAPVVILSSCIWDEPAPEPGKVCCKHIEQVDQCRRWGPVYRKKAFCNADEDHVEGGLCKLTQPDTPPIPCSPRPLP